MFRRLCIYFGVYLWYKKLFVRASSPRIFVLSPAFSLFTTTHPPRELVCSLVGVEWRMGVQLGTVDGPILKRAQQLLVCCAQSGCRMGAVSPPIAHYSSTLNSQAVLPSFACDVQTLGACFRTKETRCGFFPSFARPRRSK